MKRLSSVVIVLACARAALAQEAGGAANVQTESPAALLPENAGASGDGERDEALVAARDAFRSGAAHARAKEWGRAREDFRRSAALRPHPVTTYDIGYCDKELGHAARARKELRVALSQRDVTGATLPERYRTEALRYVDALERTVARVTVVVDRDVDRVLVDQAPLEMDLDGEASRTYFASDGEADTGPAVSGRIVILLDPGKHVLLGTRAGLAQTSMRVEVSEGQALTLELFRTPAPARDAPALPAHQDQPGPDWRRIGAFTAFGVGAVGLVTGTIFGIMALNKKQQLDNTHECSPVGDKIACPTDRSEDVDSLHFRSDAATVGFVVGGVGVATGAAVLLLSSPPAAKASQRTGLQLFLGPESVAVRGAF